MRKTNSLGALAAVVAIAAGCTSMPTGPMGAPQPTGPRYHVQISLVQYGQLLNTPLFKQVRYIGTEINKLRAAKGLAPLTIDTNLTRASAGHVMDMAARNFETHNTPDNPPKTPEDRLNAAGVTYTHDGEITATTFENDENPATHAMDFWIHSPKHLAQIMMPDFKRMGIFLTRQASNGKWIYNVDFAD